MAAALPDAQSAAWALALDGRPAAPGPPPRRRRHRAPAAPAVAAFWTKNWVFSTLGTVKTHFSSSLPPGVDTVWFEYKGLPLKWYIPIGVLYDLLCADPERPWNLTVHFRGYPAGILSPCEGEDSVKWNYNNSLKEAAFIITGNSKNVMNMSQADQLAMWESVRKSEADNYMNISTKLKLGPFEEDFLVRTSSLELRQGSDEPESPGSVKPCRVPVRLYVRRVQEDLEYLEDAIPVSDWESVSYINRPFEIRKEGEMVVAKKARVKLVRIQGMELGADTPFLWVANNLRNPECFLHVCVYIGA